jgi:asparagine synthase (glutamine-hydrolysing)
VLERSKQPYRAPDAAAFFSPAAPDWIPEMLKPDSVRDAGFFDPRAVRGLVDRCRAGKATGFRENQALVGILSTQLWRHSFMEHARPMAPLSLADADVILHPQNRTTTAVGALLVEPNQ